MDRENIMFVLFRSIRLLQDVTGEIAFLNGIPNHDSINVNSKQYEGKYRSAMYAAVKAANPNWQPGQPFDSSILDSVTRELVESNLVQSGNQFVRKSIDYSV